MKKFILALCVITAACSVPKSVISDPYEKEWFPGDTVVAANICKSSKTLKFNAPENMINPYSIIGRIVDRYNFQIQYGPKL